MIKENTIYFGYGDVAVGVYFSGITFQGIKPPQECGSIVDKTAQFVTDVYILELNFVEATSLQKEIEEMIKTNKGIKISVKNYVLDFTNYNISSAKVVIKYLGKFISNIIMCLAC